MPSPKTLLPWLLGAVVGVGGILQGLHWRAAAASARPPGADKELSEAREQIAMLERENASLRSLAQGGGELAVDRRWIDHAEKEFGLHFLSTPVVHRIAGEELRDRVAAALEIKFGPSGIDDRQEAYRLIGWLGPEDDLLAQLTAIRAVGAKGWFDDVSGEAWVTDRFDPEGIPDQAVLLRLLAHILLNQNFPPPPAYPGDDAARARNALHQGAAAGSEARFLATHARTTGFVPMTKNPMVEQFFASLPPFIQGLAGFPVTEGKGLADTLFVQGNEKLHAALRSPPQTTRAVYFPADPFSAPAELTLPDLPEEAYLSESAGMLGLFLRLKSAGDAGLAREIASAWKNDRYLLIPDGDASTAVVWDIELDSESAADKLQAAIDAFERGEGRQVKTVRPSPTRVRFLNTATRELAETLD